MIQQFTNSIKTFWKKSDKYIIILVLFFSYVLFELLEKFHLTDIISINQLLNNIIQFSGIFSAILITYVISKVFQIRQERMERFKEIVKIANKVTDFRRIARILVQCYGFWDSRMRKKLDNQFRHIDHFVINDWDYENQDKIYSSELIALRSKFQEEENIPGAYLYLDMKSLVLDGNTSWQLDLYDRFDHDKTYPIELLRQWTHCRSGNTLWTCFKYKYHNYKGCFDLTAIGTNDAEEIEHLASKINGQKYRNRKFDKDLLADVGNDMDTFYLPRLHKLTYYNTLGLSGTLNFLLTILLFTIISGVLAPLLLTALKVDFKILLVTSSFSVSILCLSLFYFLTKFKKILTNEIKIG